MMQNHRGTFFGDTQKVLAHALHDAGQTDREIADATATSVNNIRWWRGEEGLPEHLSPEAAARAAEEAYTPPVSRAAEPAKARQHRPSVVRQVTDDPRLVDPAEAQRVYTGAAAPSGDHAIEMGTHLQGAAFIDLEELLTTRLLVQGNSGSGKSHLLRRLLEESTGLVQQVIVDPEGDFASFGETFGHTVIDARGLPVGKLRSMAAKARQHRPSIVLNLEGLEIEQQMDAVAAFLGGLFDAPREHWFPALVVVDEAHLFAPSADNGEDKETRKASQTAMADLMCRGRKRGLAGVLATQRLAKLHKNVAAEASNFLMGRTFLDIDLARAADLLGLPRAQVETIRNLNRGEFLGLGPAVARRPLKLTIGPVQTAGKAGAEQGLVPLPMMNAAEIASLMFADDEEEDADEAPKLRVVR
jgi:hypothetical protein